MAVHPKGRTAPSFRLGSPTRLLGSAWRGLAFGPRAIAMSKIILYPNAYKKILPIGNYEPMNFYMFLVRRAGFEPASPAWEAGILPLDHRRKYCTPRQKWAGADLNRRPPRRKRDAIATRPPAQYNFT